ncbi:hypothetical protein E3T28_12050 [Cryobacterium sinapicolor]|uniref:WxL domain-containing protein n=1 Tax=Cryobacterium sinapicolor TaxID=1259236 RepID=A0ABY2J0N3_9MICO|nr:MULTISPECIES: hypothetical protein [Cryobacterium]TFC85126.1 hypothetical protein E3O67_12130 [Cryobacterium sp. TMT3-29-2]TFC96570.1 hypothetical protein E3T28_12050 [Cryobacterium sinapicolor]
MKLNTKTRTLAVGALSIALLAGTGVAAASAVVQTNGSAGAVYMYDAADGSALDAPGYSYGWDDQVVGSPDGVDPMVDFSCPAGTTNVYTFATTPGTELGGTNGWKAFSPNSLTATGGVLLPNTTPSGQINGTGPAIKAAGGTYSLGFACTINNGVTTVAAYYRTATITAGTGAYTLSRNDTTVVVPPVVPGPQNGTVALAPTTTGAVNGVLALTVPAGAAASFGTPSLVNNKSTTTGTLGNITVNDGRVLTREGWNLSATVADFKNSTDATNIISKSQLGVAPKLVVAGTSATGVTAAAVQVAGAASGTYNFASGSAANTVGDSVLNADLTFVAPQDKAAGTYTSTMTLTVVSK